MSNNKKEETELVEIDLKDLLSKNWNKIILAFILLSAFYLRLYHIDYPVVDYHNWREITTLSAARNFEREGFFKYGFFVPRFDYSLNMYENQNGVHADVETFPIVSVFISIFFKIFGEQIWIARLVTIFLNLATIFLIYKIAKEFTKDEIYSLISAFVAGIMPLYVFFSRNPQQLIGSLFFLTLSLFLLLRWKKDKKLLYLIFSSLSLALAIISKYSMLIILLPFIVFFLEEKKLKQIFLNGIVFIVPLVVIVLSWFCYDLQIGEIYGFSVIKHTMHSATGFYNFFLPRYWAIMYNFFIEVISYVGFLLFIFGIILIFSFKIKGFEFFRHFLILYFFAFLIFIFVGSSKLMHHSYHQFPLSLLYVYIISYPIYFCFLISCRYIKNYLKFGIIFVFLLILFFSAKSSINAMFNTQFFGLDVAGEYIKKHSEPWERLFYSGHQSFGVLWHAERFGYPIKIPKPEDFEFAEKNNLNVSWLFIYQWGFDVMGVNESWNYIKNNFRPVQIAFIRQGEKFSPIYLLLKKGGNFNETLLNQKIQEKINKNEVGIKEYELSYGKVYLYYLNFE